MAVSTHASWTQGQAIANRSFQGRLALSREAAFRETQVRKAPGRVRLALAALGLWTIAASAEVSFGQEALRSESRLRLNQIQVVGSHNSYKQAIDPSLFSLYSEERPTVSQSLDYSHPSLTEQLELGLRKLELDVFHDPDGGLFAQPSGLARVDQAGLPAGPPFDPRGEMKAPGFKVLHVQDLDFRSNCLTLQACLSQLRGWSRQHPDHLPIVVTVNAKDGLINRPGFTTPKRFDAAALDDLDREIVAGIGRAGLLVPDDVRGERHSLEQAVLAKGWPLLDAVRGRFLFVLDEQGAKQRRYVDGHAGLRGRVMFVNAEPGSPEAGFLILNDPLERADEIRRRVEQGYLVRTRADADTREARSGDVSRRDAAFESGAQFISTDYYQADPRFDTGYSVEAPGGGWARCNPVTAPPGCRLP